MPDPDAMFVDALLVNWNNFLFYIFSPFSPIGKCLEKNSSKNKAEGILIVTCWTCQSWYSISLRLPVASLLMITHWEIPPDSSRVPETSPFEEKAETISLSFVTLYE